MRRCRPLLGTFVEIDCDCADAIDEAFAAIERVHRLMSAHEPDSELSRINRVAHRRPLIVSGETAEVLNRALYWSRVSSGSFDVVRAGAKANLPRHPGQAEPDPAANWTVVQLDGRTVSLARSACLDLGGIAKGYAVDRAIAALCQAGASSGLVNAGGDLRAFGDRAWPISVVEPMSRHELVLVELGNAALATSAGLADGSGLSFDHLMNVDPGWTSVTVRGRDACDADALTKIVWALGQGAAPLLADVGAEAFALRTDGSIEPIQEQALAA